MALIGCIKSETASALEGKLVLMVGWDGYIGTDATNISGETNGTLICKNKGTLTWTGGSLRSVKINSDGTCVTDTVDSSGSKDLSDYYGIMLHFGSATRVTYTP